jgi:chemotaxis signal transduction protein
MPPDESGAEFSSGARILDDRARGLSRPFGSPGSEGNLHLIVRAGDRRVALPMEALRSVVEPPPITRLPPDGRSLVGVVALGGEVVPVAGLATLLGSGAGNGDNARMLVVVEDGDSQLALEVDGVEGHEALIPHLSARIDLSDAANKDTPALTTPVGEEGLLVLDVNAALADPRLCLPDARFTPGPQGSR